MCGIAGFVDFRSRSSKEFLVRMTDELHHRGPDDSGYYFEDVAAAQIGLGHRRLSILDLSALGHQPMVFQNLVIIYNGEVYNFLEIRLELEKLGYSFISNSDTEVILKAFHCWGEAMIHRLNGMFVIIILDTEKHTLTIIRDRAGIKPVFWYWKEGLFMFASELKSFHQHDLFKKEINGNSLALYFQYGYIPEPHTIFEDCYKLKAGHILTLNLKTQAYQEESYWNVFEFYQKPKLNLTFQEVIEQTENLLTSACEYRMVSDVPVGVFLSGGYDSSLVAALLQNSRTEKLKTFSIGFHEHRYNEAHHAKKVAKHLGTDHEEYYCTQDDAIKVLDRLPEIWDEPFADNSAIPTTLVSELAREKVTVSLSADGGDELFGGYTKYVNVENYYNKFKKIPFRKSIASSLASIQPSNSLLNKFDPYFSAKYQLAVSIMSAKSEVQAMANYQKFFNEWELNNLLIFRWENVITNYDRGVKQISNNLDRLMAIDYGTYQIDDILVKVDRATMSTSLEGREPLLDYRLIEYVAQLNPTFKIKNGNKKHLLKQIAHKYLPKEIMDRPKMGFGTPVGEWFSQDLKKYFDQYLSEDYLQTQKIFHVSAVLDLKKRYFDGEKYLIDRLWAILVFQLWYQRWMN
jgi:asparagine synthase (glutamine-hydrolysing)